MKSIHRTSSTDVTLYNDSIGGARTLIQQVYLMQINGF
jgi:hypothetical protein